MDHPTSSWASAYGLPDPGIPADAVLAARPDSLTSLAGCFGALAGALREGAAATVQAAGVLQDGWSTPTLRGLVAGAIGAARLAADTCDGNAAVLHSCADELARCRAAVRQAYAETDAAIAAQQLPEQPWPAWVAPGFNHAGQADEQRRLVSVLYGLTDAILRRSCMVASGLWAGLGPDPRPDLPTWLSGGPPTPSGSTATAVDTHNRAALQADLTSASATRRAFAVHVKQALAHAARTSGGTVELLEYDPDHPGDQGGAAIAIGDVTTADSVAVLVPGVGNSPSDMSGLLDTAASLTSAADATAPGTSTATVAWIGYTVPMNGSGGSSDDPVGHAIGNAALATNALDASIGGAQLAEFSQHLRDVMDTSSSLTLIGHSYGSMVVSEAALTLGPDAGVDDIVMLAPPGAGYGVSTAADYQAVPADHVYALAYPADPVPSSLTDQAASSGIPFSGITSRIAGGDGTPFGPDPTSPEYGAQVITVPSNVPVSHDGPGLLGSALGGTEWDLVDRSGANPGRNLDQHPMDNYLGGKARAAVAAIMVGAYARVPVRRKQR